jgi:hypothetical protein
VHIATTAQIIATEKNTNPNPNIQNVRNPTPTQIQPALTAEDFATGIGRTDSVEGLATHDLEHESFQGYESTSAGRRADFR